MKKFVMMVLIGVTGFMLMVPSLGYSNPPWRYGPQKARYAVVRNHAPRYYAAPVRYNQRNVYYVDRRNEYNDGLQIAGAALGGIILGTILGSAITQGR